MPKRARGKPIEVWFQDEARVGQQGTITRIWAPRGSRPRAPRDRRFTWAWLVGAALALPHVNATAMTLHLAEIGRCVARGAHAVVVVDGAGWHRQGGRLKPPRNISLLPLPGYAPELNPVENIWDYLRSNGLSNTVWNSYDDIIDACCKAWNWLTAQTGRINSIATRQWTTQVKE